MIALTKTHKAHIKFKVLHVSIQHIPVSNYSNIKRKTVQPKHQFCRAWLMLFAPDKDKSDLEKLFSRYISHYEHPAASVISFFVVPLFILLYGTTGRAFAFCTLNQKWSHGNRCFLVQITILSAPKICHLRCNHPVLLARFFILRFASRNEMEA